MMNVKFLLVSALLQKYVVDKILGTTIVVGTNNS
jgi:hypothetical protein